MNTSEGKMTLQELQELIIQNFNNGGRIDLTGLDFSGYLVSFNNMKAKIIYSSNLEANTIQQSNHRANCIIQSSHNAEFITQDSHNCVAVEQTKQNATVIL